MNAQQQNQLEIAIKTGGKIPPGLIETCFAAVMEVIQLIKGKKQSATLSDEVKKMRWDIDNVITPKLLHLDSENQQLKEELDALRRNR